MSTKLDEFDEGTILEMFKSEDVERFKHYEDKIPENLTMIIALVSTAKLEGARWQFNRDKKALADAQAMIEKLEKGLERCEELFRYCYGPTRDVKTYKLQEGEEIAIKLLEELKQWRLK